jgi:uncharacterized LabA/DUF88 family protein
VSASAAPNGSVETVRHVGILVDFDNAFPPSEVITESSLRHMLLACVRRAAELAGGRADMRVRLYGGWMSGGLLSRRGSDVAALLGGADPFPLVTADGEAVRGTVELAHGIIDEPGMVLEDTYRRRGSIPRLRLRDTPLPAGCVGEAINCPAKILARFTKAGHKQCPTDSCGVTATSAFVVHEQKMVDTLLVCDFLALIDDASCAAAMIVSGDTDFVPALMLARRKSVSPLSWLIPTELVAAEGFIQLVRQRGVQVDLLHGEVP